LLLTPDAAAAAAPVGEKEQRDTETEEPRGATRRDEREAAGGDRWKQEEQEEWRWGRA